MIQISTPTTVNRPRLVRFINDLGMGAPQISHEHFTQRLGQLFDLPGSIAVAAAQVKRPPQAPEADTRSRDQVQTLFLRGREAIVRGALKAFLPDGGVRIRFPVPAADADPTQTLTPERYIAFYAAQQREADFRVRQLHADIRAAVAGCSPELDRLCALDKVLGKQLAGPGRRFFEAVPQLLQHRFEHLLGPYRPGPADPSPDHDAWRQALAQYRTEMQGMLLAEIETRLLPTTGLVEALAPETPQGNP